MQPCISFILFCFSLINQSTDDIFLLGFLRYAHYEHSTAQKRIDNFCSLRCSPKHGITEWFNYPDLSDPIVDEYLDSGILVPLGTVDSGVHMFLMRLKAWKPERIPQVKMRTMNNMCFERFLLNEKCQIGGTGIFIDMSDTTSKQVSEWTDTKTAKSAIKLLQVKINERNFFFDYSLIPHCSFWYKY
ncbi:unnamed protein product [Trichobilharzia regenti]|nr:unnamed protein product [Trichobilharzia regenti]